MPLYKDKRLGRGVILWKIEPTHNNDSVQIDIFVDYAGPIFNEKQANIVQKSTFLIKNNVFSSLFRFSTYSSYSTYSPNYATEIKVDHLIYIWEQAVKNILFLWDED